MNEKESINNIWLYSTITIIVVIAIALFTYQNSITSQSAFSIPITPYNTLSISTSTSTTSVPYNSPQGNISIVVSPPLFVHCSITGNMTICIIGNTIIQNTINSSNSIVIGSWNSGRENISISKQCYYVPLGTNNPELVPCNSIIANVTVTPYSNATTV